MRAIQYFLTMASPWAYLGHATFMMVARRHEVSVRYRPLPIRRVFDQTGGLPLPKRHPARQRYRLVEMQRWRERRGLPLNLAPRHSPFDASLADRVVIAIQSDGGDPDGFMRRAFAGLWAEERDLGDPATLVALLAETGHDPERILAEAQDDAAGSAYEANHEEAVGLDVFGAPSYVLDGEVFWGQDRLELLDDALETGRPAFRPG